jgi:hypothetical protein
VLAVGQLLPELPTDFVTQAYYAKKYSTIVTPKTVNIFKKFS